MPLFDRNAPSAEITPEIIDEINRLIERLQGLRVMKIVLPEPKIGLRVPNLVRCYLQAHIRRCLMFLEGGVAELGAGRPLVTELCTRSIYESIATICDFCDKLKPLCEASDYLGVERLVTNAAFTTRIPSFLEQHGEDVKAPQILNLIDRMNKRHPSFREAYDHLSDIVHPNGLGAVVYFTTMGEGMALFADSGNNPDRARMSLLVAALLLAHVELSIAAVEQQLQKLTEVTIAKHRTEHTDQSK